MALIVAILLGVLFSSLIGWGYGILLNRVKGDEMTVSTYVGFSIIAFMNIMWPVSYTHLPGTKLVIGTGDATCSSIGAGNIGIGDACLTGGSSAGINGNRTRIIAMVPVSYTHLDVYKRQRFLRRHQRRRPSKRGRWLSFQLSA